jgi:hypothetical protein
MFLYLNRALVGLLMLLMSAANTAADSISSYTLCIGEFDKNCPVAHDASGPCGANPDDLAKNICSLTVNGQKQFSPYRLIQRGVQGGNRCGYAWYTVECHDAAPSSGQPQTPQGE